MERLNVAMCLRLAVICLLLLLDEYEAVGQHGRRPFVVERSVVMKVRSEPSCNTDPHICDAKMRMRCCRGKCRDVGRNVMHCGRCGKKCSGAHSCCSGSCSNLNSDHKNCGACGNACQLGVKCQRGICGYDD